MMMRLARLLWCVRSSSTRRSLRANSSMTSTVCATLWLAARSCEPIVTLTGRTRNSIASFWMACGHVAENMSVWRSARIGATILRISGSKPMSSMRSASSSTRYVTSCTCAALFRFARNTLRIHNCPIADCRAGLVVHTLRGRKACAARGAGEWGESAR